MNRNLINNENNTNEKTDNINEKTDNVKLKQTLEENKLSKLLISVWKASDKTAVKIGFLRTGHILTCLNEFIRDIIMLQFEPQITKLIKDED